MNVYILLSRKTRLLPRKWKEKDIGHPSDNHSLFIFQMGGKPKVNLHDAIYGSIYRNCQNGFHVTVFPQTIYFLSALGCPISRVMWEPLAMWQVDWHVKLRLAFI